MFFVVVELVVVFVEGEVWDEDEVDVFGCDVLGFGKFL